MSDHVEHVNKLTEVRMDEKEEQQQLDISGEADVAPLSSEDRKDTHSHTDKSAAGPTCCQTSEREEQQYPRREEGGVCVLPSFLRPGVAHIKSQ